MSEVTLKPWTEVEALLPPLSSDRREALKNSVAGNGLLVPLLCLPDGRLIDGYHRWRACQQLDVAPRVEVRDVGEAEALDLALTLNVARRQLSPEQRKELGLSLRKQGWTQQRVASALGVVQQTVDAWEGTGRVTKIGNASPPDLRMRVSPSQQKMIGQRVAAGEPQAQVAADFNISRRRAGQIAKQMAARQPKPETLPGREVEPDEWFAYDQWTAAWWHIFRAKRIDLLDCRRRGDHQWVCLDGVVRDLDFDKRTVAGLRELGASDEDLDGIRRVRELLPRLQQADEARWDNAIEAAQAEAEAAGAVRAPFPVPGWQDMADCCNATWSGDGPPYLRVWERPGWTCFGNDDDKGKR